MNRSENINELTAALTKVQGALKPAVFNKKNPHYNSKYADFSACMDACRDLLSSNGLAIMQYTTNIDNKANLVTMLSHVSGQWLQSEFPLICEKVTNQSIGSAITYAKRYSLCGLIGIVADEDVVMDDDAESTMGRGKSEPNRQPPRPTITKTQDLNERITIKEVETINELVQKLDKENKTVFFDWMLSKYNAVSINDIPKAAYENCVLSLNNKIKYLKDQQMAVV